MDSSYSSNPLVRQAVKGMPHYRGILSPFDTATLLFEELEPLARHRDIYAFMRGRETGIAVKPAPWQKRVETIPFSEFELGDKVIGQVSYNGTHAYAYLPFGGGALPQKTEGRIDTGHLVLVVMVNRHGLLSWNLLAFDTGNPFSIPTRVSNLKIEELSVTDLADLMGRTKEDATRPFFSLWVYSEFVAMLERKLKAFRDAEAEFTGLAFDARRRAVNVKRMGRNSADS